ncbi:hypothetical protein BGY98DRAFT_962141 [Russula aff. rugulosa BPL654]|nr:hypothetical protein BGY98DRAFT_962141 [Russula aff. rugulosa BPL654]
MAPSRHNTRLSTVREMDDAFDDDDQDDQEESTPLTRFHPQSSISTAPLLFRGETDASRPNTYDFEREYDFPPPGSPPSPTTSALPNDYGNSNGYLPTSPVIRSSPQSIFRRTFSAILPQSYYQRVPSERPRGGGTDNDGVFANVTAKPAPLVSVQTDNGDIYIAPEETQQEAPPSYMAASADAAPSYWDTIVHNPTGVDLNGDMIIEELPTGSLLIFVLTTLISWFFQLPGFILSYLLHTTHAGRFGSQAGLALTLIQWGFGSSTVMGPFPPDEPPPPGPGPHAGGPPPGGPPGGGWRPEEGMTGNSTMMDGNGSALADMEMPYSGHEWVSFFLMTVGWFLLLTSLIGFFRVKRFELSVRASHAVSSSSSSSSSSSPRASAAERNVMLRRNFEGVFGGVSVVFDSDLAAAAAAANPTSNHTSGRAHQNGVICRAIEEARLQNDLRNAGLL